MKKYLALALALAATLFGQNATAATTKVTLCSEVKFDQLNSARGDKSPLAGTLWGDRKGTGPTGFLLKTIDGFQSPPHIHNASYKAVVIKGLWHNDDPEAESMWMGPGSFWTQPKGAVHITAARGSDTLALVHIEEAPYLVMPPRQAFESGEQPLNIDQQNLIWLDAANITWVDLPGKLTFADSPKIAFLWGNPTGEQLRGTFIKLPAGFQGRIRSNSSIFDAVVIKGMPQYRVSDSATKTLEPGSFFSSDGEAEHRVSSSADAETIIYVRSNGRYDVVPVS